jgi:serine/threonine protein kinase
MLLVVGTERQVISLFLLFTLSFSEVIFWSNNSSNAKSVDVWSVGCILSELLTGRVLFPGTEAMEQFRMIVGVCGSPSGELMDKIEQQTSSSIRLVIERLGGQSERKDFGVYFNGLPTEAIDLLDKMLVIDPDLRISVEEALKHPYMKEYFLPEDEPVAENPFDINDSGASNSTEYWKGKPHLDLDRKIIVFPEIIWQEIQRLKHENSTNESSSMDVSESSS